MGDSIPLDTGRYSLVHRLAGLKSALPAVFLCLIVNLTLFVGIVVRRPTYLSDYRQNANPDAKHYVLLGRNFLLHGEYSRCEKPPYVPDMLRTPVYPLFAGTLDLLGGAGALYLAQALLQAGSCLLLFVLARSCFGARAAFWASLLLASDMMLTINNFEAMSETLFVFLLLSALVYIVPSVFCMTNDERGSIPRLAIGGTLLGLCILTRPVALYLPLLLVGSVIALGWQLKQMARSIRAATLLLLAIMFLPALWIARNAVIFSLPRLTTVDAANNVYFVGGGAYQMHWKISLEDAQALIAKEHGLPTYEVSQNPWISNRPLHEIDSELRRAALPVVTKYPFELVQSSLLGIVKASLSHNTSALADLLALHWAAPSMPELLHLRPEALARLEENGSLLDASFLWQLFHTLLSLILAILGAIAVARDGKTRPAAFMLISVLAYFYLTVAVFGLEAFYRCRVPVLPFLYLFAGAGLNRVEPVLSRLLKQRSLRLPVGKVVL